MKRFLTILMLLVVLGCGKRTPEQRIEFWEGMFVQAAEDTETARTLEEYTDACYRMEKYGNYVIKTRGEDAGSLWHED